MGHTFDYGEFQLRIRYAGSEKQFLFEHVLIDFFVVGAYIAF
jgi:hypothetical protein